MILFYFLMMVTHLALAGMAYHHNNIWSGVFFSVAAMAWAICFALELTED